MTATLPPLVPPSRCPKCDTLLQPVGVVLECPRGCLGPVAKQWAMELRLRDQKPFVDRDAWLARPQPTFQLCRLFHGIDCRRGCGQTEAS